MNANQWFKSKKIILLGGAIGVIICAVLFLFYSFVYFPAFQTGDNDTEPSWLLIPPALTGHAFPLMSPLFFEGSPLVDVFCKATNPNCVEWTAGNVPGCKIPKTEVDSETGKQIEGCCTAQIMTPEESCREKVITAGFVGLTALLVIIYFIIGVLIAWQIQKRR